MPTNVFFRIKPLKVKLFAGEQKATELLKAEFPLRLISPVRMPLPLWPFGPPPPRGVALTHSSAGARVPSVCVWALARRYCFLPPSYHSFRPMFVLLGSASVCFFGLFVHLLARSLACLLAFLLVCLFGWFVRSLARSLACSCVCLALLFAHNPTPLNMELGEGGGPGIPFMVPFPL